MSAKSKGLGAKSGEQVSSTRVSSWVVFGVPPFRRNRVNAELQTGSAGDRWERRHPQGAQASAGSAGVRWERRHPLGAQASCLPEARRSLAEKIGNGDAEWQSLSEAGAAEPQG